MYNLFVIVSFALLLQNNSSNFLVSTKILNTLNRKEVVLKVDITNISKKPVKVAKKLMQYYKWDEGKNSGGNYIIEIQKFENGKYDIFSPTVDIDIRATKEEYTYIESGNTITDTLQIKGYLFSRYKEYGEGFPTGKYRIRIYFKPSWMGMEDSESCSKWIEFKMAH